MLIFVDYVNSAAQSDPSDYLDIMCSHFQKYGDRYVYTATTSLTYENVTKSSSTHSNVFTSFASMSIAITTMYIIYSKHKFYENSFEITLYLQKKTVA